MGRAKLEVGDRIKFRALTRWNGDRTVWRKVTGFVDNRPTVRFGGWSNFIVRLDEIQQVEKGVEP